MSPEKRPWLDTHIHVSDIGPDGSVRHNMLQDLLTVLDVPDADLRFVVSCDGPYFSKMIQSAEGVLEANRFVHELVSRAPGKLYGACCVNPHFPRESLQAMELCFERWGFVMLGEMLQYMMDYEMDSDEVEPLLLRAESYGVPVQVHLGTYWHKDHTGSTDGMHHMRDLLRVADRVPGVKYILAHAIGCGPTPAFVSWADMFLDTLGGVFERFPDNFWVEIRDFHSPALARTLREVPTNRLLAGTDWTTRIGPPFQPYGTVFDIKAEENPFPPGVDAFVRFLRQAGATEEALGRIGYTNAAELMGVEAAP